MFRSSAAPSARSRASAYERPTVLREPRSTRAASAASPPSSVTRRNQSAASGQASPASSSSTKSRSNPSLRSPSAQLRRVHAAPALPGLFATAPLTTATAMRSASVPRTQMDLQRVRPLDVFQLGDDVQVAPALAQLRDAKPEPRQERRHDVRAEPFELPAAESAALRREGPGDVANQLVEARLARDVVERHHETPARTQ